MTFDPYHKWLGIPKDQRPPTHYQLLGLAHGESDSEVIEEAAIRQMSHLRGYQIGTQATECTRILNEVAKARSVLLDPAKRKQYEQQVAPKTTAVTAEAPEAVVSPFDQLDSANAKAGLVSVKRTQKSGAALWIGIGAALVLLIAGTIAVVVIMNRGGDTQITKKDDDKPKPKPPPDEKPKPKPPDDKVKPIEEKDDDPPPLGNTPRDRVLAQAAAYWNLGLGGKGSKHPLTQAGAVQLRVPAEGTGARPGAKVARLDKGYFDAGNAVQAQGDRLTLLVRAHDPQGTWNHALFARRLGPDSPDINFNLAGAPGAILFEFNTDAGAHILRMPLARVDAKAWHDLLVRYDGEWLQLWCDGTLYAEMPCKGAVKPSSAPVLIGAAADRNNIAWHFTGEIEEAALWHEALTDADLVKLFRQPQLARAVPNRPVPPAAADLVEIKPGEVYRSGKDTNFIRFTPDGRFALFLQPRGVVVWNVEENKEVRILSGVSKSSVLGAIVTQDGKYAAGYTTAGDVLIWNLETGVMVRSIRQPYPIGTLAFSHDQRALAVSTGSPKQDHSVRLYDIATGNLVKSFDNFTQTPASMALDETTLYAVDPVRKLYRCNLQTGTIDSSKQLTSFSPYVRFTADVKQMAFLKSGRIVIWDLADDKELRGADLPADARPNANGLHITPDGRMAVVSLAMPNHLLVFDLVKGVPIKTLEGHKQGIRATGLSPDGTRAMSMDYEKMLRIWKLDDAVAQVAALKPETKPETKPEVKPETKFDAKLDPKFIPEWESIKVSSYSAVAITPDGKWAVTAGPGLDIWDLATGNLVKKLNAGAGDSAFGSLALSPDGSQALAITGDNLVRLWDLAAGRMVRSHVYGTRPNCVAWASNGQVAAVGGRFLYIIDPESLATKHTVTSSKEGDVLCADFYGQGSQIVFGHEGGAVRAVPSTGTGARTVYTQVDGTAVYDVVMTGNLVISGGVDKLFYVWDTIKGRGERLDGKTVIRAVATSPKGTYALSAGEDKKIRFWHIKTGRLQQVYTGHDATVRSVAFSPNGQFFLSTSEDGTLRAWKLPKDAGVK